MTNWADIDSGNNNASSPMAHSLRGLFDAGKRGVLEQLSPSYCVVMFGDTYQTSYGKVLLVVDDNSTYGLLYTNPVYQPAGYSGTDDAIAPYEWLCPADVNQETCIKQGTGPVQSKADNHEWIVNSRLRDGLFDYSTSGSIVQYCLAEPAPENCSLQYSIPLTIATIVCNIVKTCVLLYIWLKMKDIPILTIGDAIASFLRCPDPHSKDLCLAPNGKGAYIPIIHATPRALYDSEERRPVKYTDERRRRGAAVSSRWGFFIFLYVLLFSCQTK